MVCPGVLSKLLLLSLLSSEIVDVEAEVDVNALRRLVDHIENTYQPTPESPPASPNAGATASACSSVDVFQYAVSIRVAKKLCESNTGEQITGLPDRTDVMTALSIQGNNAVRVYMGDNLVAARPKGEGTNAVHSERMLLMERVENVQPMEHLIGNHHDDCVVFYTYNSPCMDYCLNQKRDDNEDNRVKIKTEKNIQKGKHPVPVSPAVYKCIIAPLERLFKIKDNLDQDQDHGPRAFVFNKIYVKDESKEDRLKALLPLAQVVPLYRCQKGRACVFCGKTEDSLKANNC